jgi:hypothetical protein
MKYDPYYILTAWQGIKFIVENVFIQRLEPISVDRSTQIMTGRLIDEWGNSMGINQWDLNTRECITSQGKTYSTFKIVGELDSQGNKILYDTTSTFSSGSAIYYTTAPSSPITIPEGYELTINNLGSTHKCVAVDTGFRKTWCKICNRDMEY